MTETSITCPRCDKRSSHPKDVAEGYCGHCHDWTSGAFSGLAFREFLLTGELPQWRQDFLEGQALASVIREAMGQEEEGLKCPGCDLKLPENDLPAQVEHMEREHPEIIDERLKAAGFVRGPSGAWIDTLSET